MVSWLGKIILKEKYLCGFLKFLYLDPVFDPFLSLSFFINYFEIVNWRVITYKKRNVHLKMFYSDPSWKVTVFLTFWENPWKKVINLEVLISVLKLNS